MPVRSTPTIGGGMLHLGISSARNPLALRESLHSRLRSGIRILVAVSATSKCRGLIPRPDQNIWYTPFYFRDIWHYRRIWAQMDLLLQTDEKPAEQVTGKLKSSAALPPLPLQETKTGQLTLF